jgi:hypothetical protein
MFLGLSGHVRLQSRVDRVFMIRTAIQNKLSYFPAAHLSVRNKSRVSEAKYGIKRREALLTKASWTTEANLLAKLWRWESDPSCPCIGAAKSNLLRLPIWVTGLISCT